MNRPIALLVLAPVAALLVAAGPAPYSRTDPGFGMTVETNIVAQTIDMTPHYAGVPLEGSDGRRSSDAYKRYQTGTVKKLLQSTGDAKVGSQGGATETTTVTTPGN
jgi:glycine betaine/choline ABC-type transport system substrate-binding protein